MAEGFFSSAVINVSNPIVAAKHASPHCDLEVKKERRKTGEGGTVRQLPNPAAWWECFVLSVDTAQTKWGENPDFKHKGWRWTATFPWCSSAVFLCGVICPILQLQHILDINDHTHFVRRLSPGRGRDVLGECLCVRELSGHKLI